MSYTFTFFEKGKTATGRSDSDVIITILRNGRGALVNFRKVDPSDVSKTGYIALAVPAEDLNKLFFIPRDKKKGYKLFNDHGNCRIQVTVGKTVEMLKRFEGEYELEAEEGYIFVDKRNII